MGKTVRLRNRLVLFCDPETGFQISGDEVLPFPRKVGSLTRQWFQGGGLLIEETEENEAESPLSPAKLPSPKRIYSDQEIRELAYTDLLALVKSLGLKTPNNSKRHDHLIEVLTEYQNGLKAGE